MVDGWRLLGLLLAGLADRDRRAEARGRAADPASAGPHPDRSRAAWRDGSSRGATRRMSSSAPTARQSPGSPAAGAGSIVSPRCCATGIRSRGPGRPPFAMASPICASPTPIAYRSRLRATMRERFELCSVVTASDGPYLHDLDGHWTLDVSGSYGVNVAGFARYKEWMARGLERVQDLGPVLGPLHPVVADNIARLRALSGLDEVSFHMSGTEAVMAAVRLARFNTGRKLIVCFAGAYHGWWDGVQPGLGSERSLDDCLVLKDLNPASLERHSPAGRGDRGGARQPGAVVPSQRAAAQRRGPADQRRAADRVGDRRATPTGSRRLRAVCSECRRPARLRRGVHGLPARPRRRAGVLRRAGRHGRLRQDGGRRHAHRRRLRHEGADAALRPRAPDAHRLRGRDVLRPSGRDGRHERVPELGGRAGDRAPSTRR